MFIQCLSNFHPIFIEARTWLSMSWGANTQFSLFLPHFHPIFIKGKTWKCISWGVDAQYSSNIYLIFIQFSTNTHRRENLIVNILRWKYPIFIGFSSNVHPIFIEGKIWLGISWGLDTLCSSTFIPLSSNIHQRENLIGHVLDRH